MQTRIKVPLSRGRPTGTRPPRTARYDPRTAARMRASRPRPPPPPAGRAAAPHPGGAPKSLTTLACIAQVVILRNSSLSTALSSSFQACQGSACRNMQAKQRPGTLANNTTFLLQNGHLAASAAHTACACAESCPPAAPGRSAAPSSTGTASSVSSAPNLASTLPRYPPAVRLRGAARSRPVILTRAAILGSLPWRPASPAASASAL